MMSLLKTRRAWARFAIPTLLVISLGLAACGDGGDGGDDTAEASSLSDLPSDLPPDVAEAAEWARDNDMLFITSHDELVQLAEDSGPLNGYLSTELAPDIAEAFSEDTGIEATLSDFSGTDAYQRFLLEADAGALDDIDIQQNPPEHYDEFTALMGQYDILGMAEAGILDIPTQMIDPDKRNVVAVGSQIAGYAYNPNMIDQETIPTTWEGFCDATFLNGDRYMLDLRPSNIAPVVSAWGMDRVLEMTKCLVETDPILTRGTTDALTRVVAGEVPLHIFTNYHSTVRAMEDAGGNLDVGLIDPVPVRLSNALGVLNDEISSNPYAALLLIEWMAGPEGQAMLDQDPLKSSLFSDSSDVGAIVDGHETSGGTFEDYLQMEEWMNQIAPELGFPSD